MKKQPIKQQGFIGCFSMNIAETNQLFHHKISPRKRIYTASAKTVIFSNGFNALKMRMQYILLFEAYIFTICCYSVVLSQAK